MQGSRAKGKEEGEVAGRGRSLILGRLWKLGIEDWKKVLDIIGISLLVGFGSLLLADALITPVNSTRVRYSTKTKLFVRCPFYTKSAHLHHPLSLRNVYKNQGKFVLGLANL